MNASRMPWAAIVALALGVSACESGARGERTAPGTAISPPVEGASPGAPAGRVYDIRGTVVSVSADRKAVNLDTEEIPGLMAAMKMEYQVEDARMLEGLKAGDRVKGRLEVRNGEYVIVSLEKS